MLILSTLFLLISNAVSLRRDKSILYCRASLLIILYSISIGIISLYLIYLERGIGLYGGLFQTTALTEAFHIFILTISGIIMQLTSFYPRKMAISEDYEINESLNKIIPYKNKAIDKMAEQFTIMEYPLVLLFIIIGAVFLVSTSDLISIFLSIELQSYGLYLICTLYRDSELATSAGLIYFLLGGLSSCFILLGAALLYANTGNTSFDGLYVITSLSEISDNYNDGNNNQVYLNKSFYINISLLIMSIGFLFKISAAPFHFWSPYVYDSIPTVVTTFVATLAKLSIFIFLLELVHYTSSWFLQHSFIWTSGLLISSLLSLIVGTVMGLTQFRIKRLFAYSTISHVGFILLALSINSLESIQAFIFYLMQYSISNLNVFIILISIGFTLNYLVNYNIQYNNFLDKKNSPIQFINQIKGFFFINPVLALSLAITVFSLVGIPPLMGFFSKQIILTAALDSGYIFITLVAIITSVIGAVYYLGVLNKVFFYKPEYKLNENIIKTCYTLNSSEKNINLNLYFFIVKLSDYLVVTISILTLVILLFMFAPQEILNLANIMVVVLFNI